jgi:DNA-binding response OmpR family regulator
MEMTKILVIDDDLDILRVVWLLLSGKGFNVKSISDAKQVHATVESFQPDIILLDIQLGGVDGRDICREIKANEATKQIPVILFSGGDSIRESVIEAGADGYIQKPFAIPHFVDILNRFAKKSDTVKK